MPKPDYPACEDCECFLDCKGPDCIVIDGTDDIREDHVIYHGAEIDENFAMEDEEVPNFLYQFNDSRNGGATEEITTIVMDTKWWAYAIIMLMITCASFLIYRSYVWWIGN